MFFLYNNKHYIPPVSYLTKIIYINIFLLKESNFQPFILNNQFQKSCNVWSQIIHL